jgi:hypothetical protein
MHLQVKSILKNNRYHSTKQILNKNIIFTIILRLIFLNQVFNYIALAIFEVYSLFANTKILLLLLNS